MIKQVSQLAASISEMNGDLGKLPLTERIPDKVNVIEITLRSETSYKESELVVSLEEPGRVRDDEDALAEGSCPDETELVAEPQFYKALKESSREATEEPDEGMKRGEPFAHHKKEETMDYMYASGKLEITLLCLQAATLPSFRESIKELTLGRIREDLKYETMKLETPIRQEETSSPGADV